MRRFRLASYSDERLHATIINNLEYLNAVVDFNLAHNLLFFRVSSDLVPFASHPICKYSWQAAFKNDFENLGRRYKRYGFRISMHPSQFVILNSTNPELTKRTINELEYHREVLDLMRLDTSAKIQIHVGGVYNDKNSAIIRFIEKYNSLSNRLKKRLVIENDERSFHLSDCLEIHKHTGVPVILDTLHHQILNNGESHAEALHLAAETWQASDGPPMVDYSTQEPNARTGRHCYSIDLEDFKRFLSKAKRINPDVMLEIKDKEVSAIQAVSEVPKMSSYYIGC